MTFTAWLRDLKAGFGLGETKTEPRRQTMRRRNRARLGIERLEDRLVPTGFTRYLDVMDIGGSGETPIVGDWNADGWEDIGVYIPRTNDARWALKLNQGNGTFASSLYHDSFNIGGPGEAPIVGDFNGDGYDDIGIYKPVGTVGNAARWVVKLNNGNGTFARLDEPHYVNQFNIGGFGETPVVGDFNGDNRDDIGVYIPNGTVNARWAIKFNTGANAFSSGLNISEFRIGGTGEYPLIGDWNGDNYDDIGVYKPFGNVGNAARWALVLNTRSASFAGPLYIDAFELGGFGEIGYAGDFNNDSRDDIGVYLGNGTVNARWVVETTPPTAGVFVDGSATTTFFEGINTLGPVFINGGTAIFPAGTVAVGSDLILNSSTAHIDGLLSMPVHAINSTLVVNGTATFDVFLIASHLGGHGTINGTIHDGRHDRDAHGNMQQSDEETAWATVGELAKLTQPLTGGPLGLTTGIMPGSSPGVITSQGLDIGAGAFILVELDGASAGTQYDQLIVHGAVNIDRAVLGAILRYDPDPGKESVIIDNRGSGAVGGTFYRMPEGAVDIGGRRFHITYRGGDGNDVVLIRNNRPVGGNTTGSLNEDSTVTASVLRSDPDGDAVTAQLVSGPADAAAGGFSFSKGLYTYTPRLHWSGTDSFTYKVSDGELESATTYTVTFNVAPVADAPTLTVASASGSENAPIPLILTPALVDADGSETLSVQISGVPAGAQLSSGTNQGGGTWALSPAQLVGLTLAVPDNGSFTLTATAISREAANGDTASIARPLTLTVGNADPRLTVVGNQTVNEGAALSLTDLGVFTDPGFDNSALGTLETFSFSINWGDGTADDTGTATVDAPGSFGTSTAGSFDGSHIYADNGTYTVTVTVTDDDGASDTKTFQVGVNNVAPTLTVVAAQSVTEGAVLSLTDLGTFGDPGFDNPALNTAETFRYSINWGDGTAADTGAATVDTPGARGVLTRGSFDGAHIYADNGIYTVTVTVTDDDGGSDTETFQVTVNNVAPTVGFTGSGLNLDAAGQPVAFSGVRGQTLYFDGSFTDPGFDNAALGTRETFSYRIAWGDGTPDDAGAATVDVLGSRGVLTAGSFRASHIYTGEGSYTITVTVIDDDTGATVVSRIATVAVVSMQAGGDLAVGGSSTAGDRIAFSPGTNAGDIVASLDGAALGTFRPTGRLLAFGQAGNDDLQVAGGLTLPGWLYGDAGDDRLKGGAGHDLLLGGVGNDLLVGGGGRDLLIGGTGADRIVGNGDDDILIAGYTAYDYAADGTLVRAHEAALRAIMAEWTSTRDFATRRANINGGGTGERLNGDYFLSKTRGTVIEDADADFLTGSAAEEQDWFFFDSNKDRATDLKDEAFAGDLEFING